jgi:hypothetical protein
MGGCGSSVKSILTICLPMIKKLGEEVTIISQRFCSELKLKKTAQLQRLEKENFFLGGFGIC